MTSKLQVTIPKAIADQYRIAPGDELEWIASSDCVRVVPAKTLARPAETAMRLRLFDAATKRQRLRQTQSQDSSANTGRGWTREELYDRGSAG